MKTKKEIDSAVLKLAIKTSENLDNLTQIVLTLQRKIAILESKTNEVGLP